MAQEIRKIHRFDKWAEFMMTVEHGGANPTAERPLASRRNEWGDSKPWTGAHDFDEAIGFLRTGWEDGIKRLKNFQRGIPPDLYDCIMPVKEYKPELRHQISGGVIDINAHISGNTPETFLGEVIPHDEGGEVTKGKRLQTIYMNISNSCYTDEKAFFYRGAYTYAMIEHMENCGYSVELWIVNNVNGGGNLKQLIYVKAKDFGELFDNNKLAISLCSNFMLRRFMFSIQEQGDNAEIQHIQQNAYGHPCGNDNAGDVAVPEDMDLNPMYIGTVNESDPDRMLELFRKNLREYITGE